MGKTVIIRLFLFLALAIFSSQLWSINSQLADFYQYDANVKNQGISGVFRTTVNIGGETVTVKGNVIEGVVKIGTAYIPGK